MTDNIKLPPLPEGNVAHLIAAQAAEVEALRAEVERWKGQHMRDSAELRRLCQHRDEYKARADKLAEALRELEEREQRDEALLRQALEALEQIARDLPWELTGLQADTITILRDRLWKKA